MQSPEVDLIQEKSKDPRVLEVFNALRANKSNTLMGILFDVAVFAVENSDLHGMLAEATKKIDDLEVKLVALSGKKSNDILEEISNDHDLKLRVKEMEGHIKETYPTLTVDEATKAWAKMNVLLGNMVAQLTEARNANAELTTQLAAAQRGILTAHDLPHVLTNNDPFFQYSDTDPRIKFLAEEFAKIPGLTLDIAVDRWAMHSLGVSELRLELERYKEDSKKKRFAANVNAEAALELHGAKVVRHQKDSKRGKEGVAGKTRRTNEVRNAVFKWCDENRRDHLHCSDSATYIVKWFILKDPVMKMRKAETLVGFVRAWEKENNFRRVLKKT